MSIQREKMEIYNERRRVTGRPTDDEMIDSLLDEARRLGGFEKTIKIVGGELREKADEGARLAARYFAETLYCDKEAYEIRQFFLQGVVDHAYIQGGEGFRQAPSLFSEPSDPSLSQAENSGATTSVKTAKVRTLDKEEKVEKRESLRQAKKESTAAAALERKKTEKERLLRAEKVEAIQPYGDG